VLHGLGEPEVDTERQRGQDFGQPYRGIVSAAAHRVRLRLVIAKIG
jgi:hypothetical protein